jgi:hypothetical protein
MLIGCYDSAGNMLVKEKGQCLGVAGGSTANGALTFAVDGQAASMWPRTVVAMAPR